MAADRLRVATFHTGLSRKGPGLMVRDLDRASDTQAQAVLDLLAHVDADILLLLDVDWDHGGVGLATLQATLAARGVAYPHGLTLRPNAGQPSGLDLDGNGRLGEARDALGYGRFTGDGGMALLSRHRLGPAEEFTGLLWRDRPNGAAKDLLSEEALNILPLATTAQWRVPLNVAGVEITLITLAAGTPVFDGPEDRNGLRNRDELRFVAELARSSSHPLVLGRANVDPADGEGHQDALLDLLGNAGLIDPEPRGQGGGGDGHRGDPALDTVNWTGPGPLRVDYVLPAQGFRVLDAGVLWPDATDPLAKTVEAAGPGRIVWVDLAFP